MREFCVKDKELKEVALNLFLMNFEPLNPEPLNAYYGNKRT
jgi:hypothetical protein